MEQRKTTKGVIASTVAGRGGMQSENREEVEEMLKPEDKKHWLHKLEEERKELEKDYGKGQIQTEMVKEHIKVLREFADEVERKKAMYRPGRESVSLEREANKELRKAEGELKRAEKIVAVKNERLCFVQALMEYIGKNA